MPMKYKSVASHADAKKPTSKMKASKYPPKKKGAGVKKVKKY
jgi:hypothetical protein